MKKTGVIISTLALTSLLSMGALFGCASNESGVDQNSQDFANLSEYDKLIQSNSLQNLAGQNGTLACTVETYDEEGTLEDEQALQWKMTDGRPSIQWKDTIDGETQLSMSEYSAENCGAIYSVESGEKYVSIDGQNDFSETLIDEWSSLIEYEGTQSEAVTNDGQSTLAVTETPEEGAESFYVTTYTYDANTYVLSSIETIDYSTEDTSVLDRIVVKDISTTATLDLGENPYQTITGGDENSSCNLTVVINQANGEQITSAYKVSRDAIVDLLIAENYDMYSDEAMTNLIEDIDVSGASATVYVKVSENDSEGIDIDADEPGTEYVSDDGAVLTLGEDGVLYDEEGNPVEMDSDDSEGISTEEQQPEAQQS